VHQLLAVLPETDVQPAATQAALRQTGQEILRLDPIRRLAPQPAIRRTEIRGARRAKALVRRLPHIV
jgi:hypothetical protein